MAAKTDALRKRYAFFSRGDLDRALDLWTDDFVWDGDESYLPGSGRYEGKQAAIDVLRETVVMWDTFGLTADEFIEQGDTVIVLGHIDVTKGDRSGRLRVVHIWRYRGKQICALQIIIDTLGMARVLGLA